MLTTLEGTVKSMGRDQMNAVAGSLGSWAKFKIDGWVFQEGETGAEQWAG